MTKKPGVFSEVYGGGHLDGGAMIGMSSTVLLQALLNAVAHYV